MSSLESLLNVKVVSVACYIQAIFIQNIYKIYARIVITAEEEDDKETIEEVLYLLVRLHFFRRNVNYVDEGKNLILMPRFSFKNRGVAVQ